MHDGVETVELAPGLTICRVLNGLWQIADLERDGEALDPAATAEFMDPYVEAGFTSFDMADHYGSAEVIAGRYRVDHSRGAQTQMLTKWVPEPGPLTRDTVRAAVSTALERLQADRLQLLQFHAWHYPDPAWLDALFWLSELREEGLIQHLGVTNFDAAHLRVALASGIPLVSNQVSFSLVDRRASGPLTELCAEHDVKLLAYGTLAGGFISERWLGADEPDELETWSQMKYKRFIDAAGGWELFQELMSAVSRVAGKHGVTMATVASRCLLDEPAVAGVILGTRLGRNEHVQENLAIFRLALDDEDRGLIAAAGERLQRLPGDCGDEYRKPPFLTASGDLSDHVEAIPPVFEPICDESGRERVFSGTSWETMAGYCRAVRDGDHIHVSGTTATHGDRVIGGEDPAAQTHFVIDKIQAAIESLGGRLEDVVRTRVFVTDIGEWEPVARAHGVRFAQIQPVNTLVEAKLVGGAYRVEIEADALVR